MKHVNRRHAIATTLTAFSASQLVMNSVFAQANKVTRVIIGFPPGGGVDVALRPVVQNMTDAYPGGLIIEAKPGASTRVAADFVKASPPDGTTMFVTPDFSFTLVPFTFKNVKFDPLNDFVAVATMYKNPLVLCVGPSVPDSVKTVADFLEWCKVNPKKAAYASSGSGGGPHFTGVMLSKASGVPIIHVPYKGGQPALTDVMGGQIACVFSTVAECLPRLGTGRLRALASAGTKRSKFLPQVPTMIELGYPDVVSEPWVGFYVPANTPKAIVTRINSQVNEALRLPSVIETYAKQGAEPMLSTPEATAALLAADYARWGAIVKASGFTAEE
jgi:tripartite-type tricarboxylate transporter receptor subunit TctC